MVKLNVKSRLAGLGLGFMGRSPVGLDVGPRWVTAAQLVREGQGWRLEAAARFPRLNAEAPADVKEAARIEEVLSRQGFHGHRVVLAAPAENLMSDLLELPVRTPGTPFEQIMRAEVARIHKCDPGKLEIGYWDLPASSRAAGKGTQVLSVACQHADAEGMLDVFESVGLTVVGLDARSVAVARACGPLLADVAGRISVVLILDWTCATVVVMHQGVIVYERLLKESGVRRLHETIRTQLSLDAAAVDHLLDDVGLARPPGEHLQESASSAAASVTADVRALMETHLGGIVQDLRASVVYASHQYPEASLERIVLAGECADIPGMDRQLAVRTGLEVRKATAAQLVSSPNHLLALCTPVLTAAVGLAQYEK